MRNNIPVPGSKFGIYLESDACDLLFPVYSGIIPIKREE
jgi:hypothetical protein